MRRTQLTQTNLESRFHIATGSPKEFFNDTVFQNFVDKLKDCNSDMRMDLQLLVPVFLCLYSIQYIWLLCYLLE